MASTRKNQSALRYARAKAVAVIALLLGALASELRAGEISVAVAANFREVAQRLNAVFQDKSGHHVRLSAGSTGKLYAQIVNGAPFQVFLAANTREPARLEAEQHAVAGSRFTYASGVLVLLTRDAACEWAHSVSSLRAGHVSRLAIANPKIAPYGAAAASVLTALDLHRSLRRKVVRGESVTQAYQFFVTGNAEMAFVALSQVQSGNPGHGHCIVPVELYAPIQQQAVLLAAGRDSTPARQYMQFLASDVATGMIEKSGYAVPR